MYVVLVYDVGERRVGKICKYLRTELTWVQNSVFEGELSESRFSRLQSRLDELINEEEDSVLVYVISSEKWIHREVMGIERNERSNLL